MLRKIKEIFSQNSNKILSWENKKHNKKNYPLICKFQGSKDEFQDYDSFLVKDYQSALVYKNGEFLDIFSSGLYSIENKQEQIEIIWTETKIHSLKWGIPKSKGIQTDQGIIGIHGNIKLKIYNVRKFVEEIVGGTKSFDLQDLKELINGLLLNSIRQILRNFTIQDLHSKQIKRINQHLKTIMIEEIVNYGLNLESFNILGVKL